MSKHQQPPAKAQDQTGEEHGSIKQQQRTERDNRGPDTARGSEVETRAASRNRD